MELVRIRAGRQFTVSHSFTVDRRPWSLRPIEALAREVRASLKIITAKCSTGDTRELTSLVRNSNQLLKSERERYNKYRTDPDRPDAQFKSLRSRFRGEYVTPLRNER